MSQINYNNVLNELPDLGLGLGLRSKHFNHILEKKPKVDWFEIISENFMDSGGKPRYVINKIADIYPVVMHGVSMSIGSSDPIDFDYLKNLKKLASEIKPVWISDHLCWTGILSRNSHDLLPVPLNDETLKHICERINIVQDYLERPLILENPSTYLTFQQSTIEEWDFLRFMTEETDCGLLLDVNNVYVSGFNNDFDPVTYIENLPHDKIVQMHLAGHQNCGEYIIDTHDREVLAQVWELFCLAWEKTGGVSTLLEWDSDIPEFDEYHSELLKAKKYINGTIEKTNIIPKATSNKKAVSNPVDFIVTDIGKELNQ